MSLLKEIKSHAAVAWSPIATRSNVVAIGSKEGVGVGFDNYGGELALHSMDFSNTLSTTKPLGSVKINSRFLSMDWSESPKLAAECPYGVIAGGMADGLINVWNPAKIMAGQGEEAQVGRVQRHKGAVNAVQFNPHRDSAHLLATGGSDSEVYITSLEKLTSPAVFTPGGPTSPKHTGEVVSLAWNSQVSYILATGSVNGSTMIWDLKQKKPWCELKDPHRGSVSAIAWNPDEGLHIITASGDDQRPVIRMWDLRSSTSTPLAELSEHTAGVLSLSWCPNDSGLLLSCAKDNKTLLWDLYSGKSIFEFPSQSEQSSGGSGQFFAGASGGQRRFDIKWSKRIPAVASACTFDGKVQVWGLTGTGTTATRAPKWCRRPANATFAFGGKLVTITNPKDGQSGGKHVHIHNMISEPQMVAEAESLEAALQQRDFKAYCVKKASTSVKPLDRDIWSFMQILFDKDARQHLLQHLGFDADEIAEKVARYTGKPIPSKSSEVPVAAPTEQQMMPSVDGTASAVDVFSSEARQDNNALSVENNEITTSTAALSIDSSKKIDGGPLPVYTEESEAMVRRSLLVGNFDAAVDCCLRNNQLADALLLATCGGPELWARTQEAYFTSQKRPFMSILSAVIKGELSALVNDSPLENWKETLAILSTYGKSEEFPGLCEALADRLENAGDLRGATLCFMCAVSVERTVNLWVKQCAVDSKEIGTTAALHKLVELVSVFSQALENPNQDMGPEVGRQYSAYAALLASQGRLDMASRYAIFQDTECAIMRDRIYHAAPPPGVAPPPFPFEDTPQNVVAQQQPAASQQQYGYAQQSTGASYASQPAYGGAVQGLQSNSQSFGTQPQAFNAQPASYQQPQGYGQIQQSQSGLPNQASQFQSSAAFSQPSPQAGAFAQSSYGGIPPAAQPQQSTGVNSLAAAAKGSGRVAKTPLDMKAQRTDGFVSSVGNKELTMKYGNAGNQAASPQTAGAKAASNKPLGSTDSISANDMAIVTAFNDLLKQLENAKLTSAERRQLAEMQKAKDIMFSKLNDAVLSPAVVAKLHEMVAFFGSRDFRSAQQVHVNLTTTDWADHKDWLRGVKALINTSIKRLS